jgi:hypothetical protein
MDAEAATALARAWDDGWNGEDVERIMAPFADDVVFSSPFVHRIGDDPSATSIVGTDALRAYVTGALTRTPGIRYRVDNVHLGPDSVILDYTVSFPDGRPDTIGADFLRVDGDGLVTEWRSHYPVAFTTAPLPGD